MRRFLVLIFFFGLGLAAEARDFLIPLDDRPANLLFVEQVYRIGEPREPLLTPPRKLLGRLYTPGDSDAVIDWLEERVKPGDTVFVSADMWLYGGLVASRTAAIDEGTVERRLQRLAEIGGNGVFVHVLATVPRLALRTSDAQAPHEAKLSKWAKKSDLPPVPKLMEGARKGEPVPFPSGVPKEIVLEYLGVRDRNVATIGKLIELCELGYLDSLVLGQDDSNKTGLHRHEQRWINRRIEEHGVGGRATLISGIDELSMVMVSGQLAERAGRAPVVRVVYSDPEAAAKVPPLESLPLKQMVEQHLKLAGASVEDSETADLDLYVYVPYSKPWKVPGEERRPVSEAFVERVRDAMAGGRQVAVADLSLVNRMDPFLAESSLSELSLPELEGFASWNTPANTIGTVVSQAVCHQLAERSVSWTLNQRLESEKTHQAFLLARFIDDYAYQTVVREQVRGQAKGLNSKAEPLLNLFGPVGLDIRLRLVEWARKTFDEHFLGRTFKMMPQGTMVRFERSNLEVVLPWPRVFEVEARLDLRLEPVSPEM